MALRGAMRAAAVLLIWAGFTSLAHTATKPVMVSIPAWGTPEAWTQRGPRKSEGWYLWCDSDGWHVRTRSISGAKFTGTIGVERGKFATVSGLDQMEVRGKRKMKEDFGFVNPAKTRIMVQFRTQKPGDGFDFRVVPNALSVTFDLRVDESAKPEMIHIGAEAQSPPKAAFALPANPSQGDSTPTLAK